MIHSPTVTQDVAKLQGLLFDMEDEQSAVVEYCDLLLVLLDGEKTEGCMAGISRLIYQIMLHQQTSTGLHGAATVIVQRLAKP
jgi:hypothetical protein